MSLFLKIFGWQNIGGGAIAPPAPPPPPVPTAMVSVNLGYSFNVHALISIASPRDYESAL